MHTHREFYFSFLDMLWAVGAFLFFQIGYHLIITVFGYGLGWFDPAIMAIVRDAVWILLCGLVFLINIRYWKAYFKQRWKTWLGVWVLLGFGVLISYFFFHKSPSELLIWIKYGLWYLLILLTASGLGFFLQKKIKKLTSAPHLLSFDWFKRALVGVVLLGWIWQFWKVLFPDFFFSIGYGKLDDFHFWVNPPIYYLTGLEGTLRRQGLFAGPNNYGYFLVLFFPLILKCFPIGKRNAIHKRMKSDWFNLGIILLWILTLGATLSRSALIGAIIVVLLTQIDLLRRYKKIAWSIGGFILIGILWLSALKWKSTLAHLQAKFGGICQVIEAPFGYGLGTSWPAVHHTGNLLPENYYLQLMLDLGTIGFLMRCGVIFFLFQKQKRLYPALWWTINQKEWMIQLFTTLQQGLFALLVMGLLLHVFEDSMVNYVFFVPYGMILGWLSAWAPEHT